MYGTRILSRGLMACLVLLPAIWIGAPLLSAQPAPAPAASDAGEAAPAPLTEEELEILVARIALYPDDLVALVIAASIYPLQVVQAARFIEEKAADSTLQPSDKWDGSVISLLNYPDIIKMMNDDLDWTEQLGDAAVNQQKDLLVAIQQLRDKAVANGVLQSNEQVVVENQNDNVVIESATPEVVYVPSYPPEMLYEPGYAYQPVVYSQPYPSYYYPGATYWAGFITGAAFAAVVDWDDWDSWGGDVDIDIDIDNIDIDNFRDIDWNNFDRTKINTGDFNFNKNEMKNKLVRNEHNNIANKVKDRPGEIARKKTTGRDVRKDVQQGLSERQPGARPGGRDSGRAKQQADRQRDRPDARQPGAKPKLDAKQVSKKKVSMPKAAARVDNRPKKPSVMGNVDRGKPTKVHAKRGRSSCPPNVCHKGGGGFKGGGHRGGRR